MMHRPDRGRIFTDDLIMNKKMRLHVFLFLLLFVTGNAQAQDYDIPLDGAEDLRWIFRADRANELTAFGTGGLVVVYDTGMMPLRSFRLDRSEQLLDVAELGPERFVLASTRKFLQKSQQKLRIVSLKNRRLEIVAEKILTGENPVFSVSRGMIYCITELDSASIIVTFNAQLEEQEQTEVALRSLRKVDALGSDQLLLYQRIGIDSVRLYLHSYSSSSVPLIGTIAAREEGLADNKHYQRCGIVRLGSEVIVHGTKALYRLSAKQLEDLAWHQSNAVILTAVKYDERSVLLLCGNTSGNREYWLYDLEQGWSVVGEDSISSTIYDAVVLDGHIYFTGKNSSVWQRYSGVTTPFPDERPTIRRVVGLGNRFVMIAPVGAQDSSEVDAISMMEFPDQSCKFFHARYVSGRIIKDIIPGRGGQVYTLEETGDKTCICMVDLDRNVASTLETEHVRGEVRGATFTGNSLYVLTDSALYRYAGNDFNITGPGFRMVVTDTTESLRIFHASDSTLVYVSSKKIYRWEPRTSSWEVRVPFVNPAMSATLVRSSGDKVLIAGLSFKGIFAEYHAPSGNLLVHESRIGELITDIAPAGEDGTFFLVTINGRLIRYDAESGSRELIAASHGSSYQIKNVATSGNHVLLYNRGAVSSFLSVLTDDRLIQEIVVPDTRPIQKHVILYPNPVDVISNIVRFQNEAGGIADVYIFDMKGSLVNHVTSAGSFAAPGNSGMYQVIIIASDNSVRSARLIVR